MNPNLRVSLRFRCLVPGMLALFCLSGCGGGGSDVPIEPLVPVSGKLLVDGMPMDGVVINFIPDGNKKGLGGSATTDAAGAFTIKDLNQDKEGLPVGKYKIIYSRRRRPDGSAAPPVAPGAEPDPANIQVETLPEHLTVFNPMNMVDIPPGGKTDLALNISTK